MKCIRFYLTACLILISYATVVAFDFRIGGICYNIIGDNEVLVTYGSYNNTNDYYSYKGHVIIPDSIEYNGKTYFVTSIGDNAFKYCSSLTAITIPKSIISIGKDAFWDYSSNTITAVHISSIDAWCKITFNNYYSNPLWYAQNLYLNGEIVTELVIPDSINKIGSYVFYGYSSLTAITIPESVTSIGSYAFYGCNSLTAITLPENVTSIGSYAFYGCNSLTSITLPEGVTSIGDGAFYGCSSLASITLPESVTSIGKLAFSGCGGNLTVNCNIPSYSGDSDNLSAFYESRFSKVTIGNNVARIGDYAFYYCSGLNSVTIGNRVLSIGNNAFKENTIKKTIWLTNTPPTGYAKAEGSINYVSNDQYTNLSNVKIYPYLSSMFEMDGVKYVPVSPAERTCDVIDCAYDSKATAINVSETTSFKGIAMTVKEVMPYTFYGNNHIKEVNIAHKGIIGDYAFYDCDAIETVFVSNQGNIGYKAFYDCDGIKNVDIRNQGGIGSQAFYGCSSLKTMALGDSIGSLGDEAFYRCSSLQEIVIPNSVKSLGEECFSKCSLKRVKIGDGITAISKYAFTGCSSLINVELGNSVATINNYAFQNCSSLSEICIPQSTNTIGDYAFYGCSQLTNVIIEDRTTAMALGSNDSSPLFADCPLDSVYIGGKITYNTSSSKGYSPFYRNTSLRTVVITDREEQIYDNEFYGCTNLQNVTIGNGVKSIGNYAFSGCSSLAGFSFGSSMESIGDEAFSDCTSLTSITSHAAVPPTCGTQALDDINKWECVLGVPLGNADAYYAADQWKEFFFIDDVVEVDHYVLTYVVDGEVVHTEVLKHKDAVAMLAEPTKVGYEFSGWDKTLATMPAEDVIISGTFTRLPVDNLVILDTEENFLIDEEMECEMVTYIRHFNDTQWQALYVPFEIPYDSLKNYFEVADLNNVHQYDRDNDGVTDETVIEAFKLTSGTLEANYPYLIRAKEAGEKSITVTDAALYATEENSIDCSSVRDKFTFTGTYSSLSSAELPQGEGYYTLIDGEWQPVTEVVALGGFRFFLKVDSRSGAAAAEARSIRMRIIGENGEDDTTGIDNLESTDNDGKTTVIYDLQGRKVLNTETLQEGVYIINGKKVVIK